MTSFKLTAGKPATYSRGRLPASNDSIQEDAPTGRYWAPNREPDTLLSCGCSIPWPITRLIGSSKGNRGRQVKCDEHGWQHVARKEIDRSERLTREALQSVADQTTLDIPPF